METPPEADCRAPLPPHSRRGRRRCGAGGAGCTRAACGDGGSTMGSDPLGSNCRARSLHRRPHGVFPVEHSDDTLGELHPPLRVPLRSGRSLLLLRNGGTPSPDPLHRTRKRASPLAVPPGWGRGGDRRAGPPIISRLSRMVGGGGGRDFDPAASAPRCRPPPQRHGSAGASRLLARGAGAAPAGARHAVVQRVALAAVGVRVGAGGDLPLLARSPLRVGHAEAALAPIIAALHLPPRPP
mmetsp:Transcript_11487/g.27004  ORF Transcript_11487/g.27004 Transcript_11487/m.27004 type:complete len:240 (+) Transcript_11487:1026-1745(+)